MTDTGKGDLFFIKRQRLIFAGDYNVSHIVEQMKDSHLSSWERFPLPKVIITLKKKMAAAYYIFYHVYILLYQTQEHDFFFKYLQ